jgi:predicted nuclease of predicted toxin-antitoxin system
VKFLADESCDWAVVRALRDAGHDVVAVGEVAAGAEDEVVLALAAREGRIVLTEDKDFGRLAYADRSGSAGVMLLRFPAPARKQVAGELVELVWAHGHRLAGAFIVVEPGRARIRRR